MNPFEAFFDRSFGGVKVLTIHDPLGLAWAHREMLPTAFEPVAYISPLTGRLNYERKRDYETLAVFYRYQLPLDIRNRADQTLEFRLSELLDAHRAVDDFVTAEMLAEFPKLLQLLVNLKTREEVMVTLSETLFGFPGDLVGKVNRLTDLHNTSNGFRVASTLEPILLHALAPFEALGIEPSSMLTLTGIEALNNRLFQISLKAGVGKVEAPPELIDLALKLQNTGSTRLKLGVIAEANRVLKDQLLSMLESTPVVQLERALASRIVESEISKKAPSHTLKQALDILKVKRRDYREINLLAAAESTLRLLYIQPPGQSALPKEWLTFARQRARLDIDLYTLTSEQREILYPLMGERNKQWDLEFSRYIEQYYPTWMSGKPRPVETSADVLTNVLTKEPTYLLVFDGMALDQWEEIAPVILKAYGAREPKEIRPYFSILPTATPYARNALFAGLTPAQIVMKYGDYVLQGNNHEEMLLLDHRPDALYTRAAGSQSSESKNNLKRALSEKAPLKAFIFNFIDDLIHAKHLGDDRASARRIIKAALEDSPMLQVVEAAGSQGARLLITSDHGNQITTRSARLSLDSAREDRSARYATWDYGPQVISQSQVIIPKNPIAWGLPKDKDYAMCVSDTRLSGGTTPYLAHGGISLLESIIPMVVIE